MIPGTKGKLDELIKSDICERIPPGSKVTWVSPMLPVQKQHNKCKYKGVAARQRHASTTREQVPTSKVRITSDNKRLNKAIVRQPRAMPSVQSLSYDLNGNSHFSKIDIRDAFLTVELDEQSKALTTFTTPWGLFRYKRLNMGLCIASELFQEVFSNKLSDLKNIKVAIDDVLVYGKTKHEHDEALEALLQRLMDLNLTCKYEKCIFDSDEVEFFGMTISKNGIKPKSDKLKDLFEAEAPKDVKQLRSFLGLATYFSNRIPNLSETAKCLRELLRDGSFYKWMPSHQTAFESIKNKLLNTVWLILILI